MSLIACVDPGLNTGATIGYFDAISPYRLLERFQIHGGEEGFKAWLEEGHLADVDVLICEKFVLANNEFVADTIPLLLEGILIGAQRWGGGIVADVPIVWYENRMKSALTGYPQEANTKSRRKRVRFDFLKRFGLFAAGTEFDDSNDCVVYSLIYLKLAKHMPTLMAFWRPRLVA